MFYVNAFLSGDLEVAVPASEFVALPPSRHSRQTPPHCSSAAIKLHQRDDRSFAVVVRDAATAAELARALVGGGDRCVLEDHSLAFVMPHARVEFDEHARYDRFKRLVMVSHVSLRVCDYRDTRSAPAYPLNRTSSASLAFDSCRRRSSATSASERIPRPSSDRLMPVAPSRAWFVGPGTPPSCPGAPC